MRKFPKKIFYIDIQTLDKDAIILILSYFENNGFEFHATNDLDSELLGNNSQIVVNAVEMITYLDSELDRSAVPFNSIVMTECGDEPYTWLLEYNIELFGLHYFLTCLKSEWEYGSKFLKKKGSNGHFRLVLCVGGSLKNINIIQALKENIVFSQYWEYSDCTETHVFRFKSDMI